MFKREYDVFLAYHGTYNSNGSKPLADLVYKFLTQLNYKVFYFPESGRDSYKANIIDVMKSRVFLLITNENLPKLPSGRIDASTNYELATEIDAFYALTQFGGDVSVQDSKVLMSGNYRGLEGQEANIHELFSNRTHFFYDSEESLVQLEKWLEERIMAKNEIEEWNKSHTTNESIEVFSKRSSMSQQINLPQLITTSSSIRAVGISNSELTMKMDLEAIKFAIDKGSKIELLFLAPDSKFTREREIEEGLRPTKIKNITLFNIDNAIDTREKLPEKLRSNYRIFTYDLQPRMNIIILDNYAILQYYANKLQGMSNPCFFIEKQSFNSPLYDFCVAAYEHIRSISVEMEIQ